MITMEKINDEYIDFGQLPEDIQEAVGLKHITIVMKYSLAKEIEVGEKGTYLKKNDIDYASTGDLFFGGFVEYPHQVRNGGGNMLLLVQSFPAYKTSNGMSVKEKCYAMRIAPISNENYYEVIDFETHYNLYRNDQILWKK